MTLEAELQATLPIYETASQSLWRALELRALRSLREEGKLSGRVLEIGCGDGVFSSLLFSSIDEAIDINPRSVERAAAGGLYRHVQCMDARTMSYPDSTFGIVFANCVLEHIPEVDRVLSSAARVLRAGGRLVASVPFAEMEQHLLLKSARYAALRRRQLAHINLYDPAGWEALVLRAGFAKVEFRPYLTGTQCHRWDVMDAPGMIGGNRYNAANALRLTLRIVPIGVRRRLWSGMAAAMAAWDDAPVSMNAACGAILVATR